MQKNSPRSKKAAVLNTKKSKKSPMLIVVGIALLVTAAAAGYYMTEPTAVQTTAAVNSSVDSTTVRYPVSMFADGAARHFEYPSDGMTIRYFILKSSDGIIRAAFDACDVCWPAGKGYYQDGDQMVCRNCGRRFASILVNEAKGGCNPAPLTRSVEDDQLVLQVEDILQGKTYFNFKGKV